MSVPSSRSATGLLTLGQLVLGMLVLHLLLIVCATATSLPSASRLQLVRSVDIKVSPGQMVSSFASDGADLLYFVDLDGAAPTSTIRVMNLTDSQELPSIPITYRTSDVTADWVGHLYYWVSTSVVRSIIQIDRNGTITRSIKAEEMKYVRAFAVSRDGQRICATSSDSLLVVRVNDSAIEMNVPLDNPNYRAGCAFHPSTGHVFTVIALSGAINEYDGDRLVATVEMQGQGAYRPQSILVTPTGWIAINDWSNDASRVCVMDQQGNSSDCVTGILARTMSLTQNGQGQLIAINHVASQFLIYTANVTQSEATKGERKQTSYDH